MSAHTQAVLSELESSKNSFNSLKRLYTESAPLSPLAAPREFIQTPSYLAPSYAPSINHGYSHSQLFFQAAKDEMSPPIVAPSVKPDRLAWDHHLFSLTAASNSSTFGFSRLLLALTAPALAAASDPQRSLEDSFCCVARPLRVVNDSDTFR